MSPIFSGSPAQIYPQLVYLVVPVYRQELVRFSVLHSLLDGSHYVICSFKQRFQAGIDLEEFYAPADFLVAQIHIACFVRHVYRGDIQLLLISSRTSLV